MPFLLKNFWKMPKKLLKIEKNLRKSGNKFTINFRYFSFMSPPSASPLPSYLSSTAHKYHQVFWVAFWDIIKHKNKKYYLSGQFVVINRGTKITNTKIYHE
jgi:hypothetical protein